MLKQGATCSHICVSGSTYAPCGMRTRREKGRAWGDVRREEQMEKSLVVGLQRCYTELCRFLFTGLCALCIVYRFILLVPLSYTGAGGDSSRLRGVGNS